jgi:hypothetical protein
VVVPLFLGSDVVAYRIVGWVLAVTAACAIVLVLRPSVRRELA